MTPGTILITGASGFIGSAIAIDCLKAGYHLRVSLRKAEQIEKIRMLLSAYSKNFEFAIVPDITQENAFTDKLHGVDYVLHLASPLPYSIPEESCLDPAVKGTMSLLKEASNVPTIKKVLLTSSIGAFVPMAGLSRDSVIKECDNSNFEVDNSRDLGDPQRRYWASKIVADKAATKFRETVKPHYSLVTLHPSLVYGHSPVRETAADMNMCTNRNLWGAIMSGRPLPPFTGVHIQDVVDAHLRVLERDVPDGSKYLIAGPPISIKEVKQVVEKVYPDLETSFSENLDGSTWPTDTTKAETELGIRWRSLEDMIVGIVDQQLALLNEETQTS